MPAVSSTPRPWLFGLASAPYGCFNGLITVALPYLLVHRGIPVERIAAIAAFVQAPAIWYFLWAPVVDIRWRRRTWVVLLSVLSAMCAAIAIGRTAVPTIWSLTILLVAASVFNQPISSAIGGLIVSVTPNAMRGRTAGWSQAGIFVGGVVAGGVAVGLAAVAPPGITALTVGLLIAVPSLVVLAIREPSPRKTGFAEHVLEMFGDVVAMLKRRDVWVGLLFFMSPVGAGALLSLFSAVASDFHASTTEVIWVVVIAGVMTPAGALIGGMLCDRFDRWRVYPIAGLTAAVAAGALYFAPLTPASYLAGAAAYSVATGFCYATFMSLALELVGSSTAANGTRFTMFMAAVNVPVVYMLRLDGLGYSHAGVRGMIAVDAVSNAVFGLLLLVGVDRLRARLVKVRHEYAGVGSAAAELQ
jgi:MFS transporter, PAT family, beta-lactamase induction signal transducer AmpG